jgi:hypothetical protein
VSTLGVPLNWNIIFTAVSAVTAARLDCALAGTRARYCGGLLYSLIATATVASVQASDVKEFFAHYGEVLHVSIAHANRKAQPSPAQPSPAQPSAADLRIDAPYRKPCSECSAEAFGSLAFAALSIDCSGHSLEPQPRRLRLSYSYVQFLSYG